MSEVLLDGQLPTGGAWRLIHQGEVLDRVFCKAIEDLLAPIKDTLNESGNRATSVDDSGVREAAIDTCSAVDSHRLVGDKDILKPLRVRIYLHGKLPGMGVTAESSPRPSFP
jgi:hypothetical protein